MYFEQLIIKNFGPFDHFKAQFSPKGINLISGSVGSGKTQLVGALISTIFGIDSITCHRGQQANNTSTIRLKIRNNDVVEIVEREYIFNDQFTSRETKTLTRPHDLEKGSPSEQVKILLTSNDQPSLIHDPDRPYSERELLKEDYDLITLLLQNKPTAIQIWSNLQKLIQHIPNRKDVGFYISHGQTQLLNLAQEYISRTKKELPMPLIVDSPSWSFDLDIASFAAEIIGAIAETDQVIILTQQPETLLRIYPQPAVHLQLERSTHTRTSPIAYRYGFLRKSTPLPKPLVATEGKTDQKLLRAALGYLAENGVISDLGIDFCKYSGGSSELLKFCMQSSKIPQPQPVICVFDRDESNILKQVTEANLSYKSWGNNVFSFAIPVPDHRKDFENISIEFYLYDDDIKRLDEDGRRLFLSTEFDDRSGKHLSDKRLNCTLLKKLQEISIIDDRVFDENNRNVALSKDDFATYVLEQASGFEDIDLSSFSKIFKIVESICGHAPLNYSDL